MASDSDDLVRAPGSRGRRRARCGRSGRPSNTTPPADAQEQWQRNQTFRDWLIAAMHAGDRLAVTIVDQRFTGTVEEVGDDLLGLRCDLRPGRHASRARHPDAHRARRPPAERRPPRARPTARSRRALAARDPEADTSVGTIVHPEGLDGQITAGSDFVTIKARAGAVTVVPMTQIAWVCNRRV